MIYPQTIIDHWQTRDACTRSLTGSKVNSNEELEVRAGEDKVATSAGAALDEAAMAAGVWTNKQIGSIYSDVRNNDVLNVTKAIIWYV